jgi:hypothetical protein
VFLKILEYVSPTDVTNVLLVNKSFAQRAAPAIKRVCCYALADVPRVLETYLRAEELVLKCEVGINALKRCTTGLAPNNIRSVWVLRHPRYSEQQVLKLVTTIKARFRSIAVVKVGNVHVFDRPGGGEVVLTKLREFSWAEGHQHPTITPVERVRVSPPFSVPDMLEIVHGGIQAIIGAVRCDICGVRVRDHNVDPSDGMTMQCDSTTMANFAIETAAAKAEGRQPPGQICVAGFNLRFRHQFLYSLKTNPKRLGLSKRE